MAFRLVDARDAASFLSAALDEYSGHRGVNGESAAQRMLYGYLVGRFGAEQVRKEVRGYRRQRIDFVVGGSAALELIVRQPSQPSKGNKPKKTKKPANVGTAARTYIMPGPKRTNLHLRANVRKLLHFRGDDATAGRFLIIIDRHTEPVSWDELSEAYRSTLFKWRGRRQAWHRNSFRLIHGVSGAVQQALIQPHRCQE